MKKILVVDDDKYNVKLVKMALSRSGFEVLSADNGAEGVAKAKEYVPDIILMDIQMPVMDGVTAMKELKKEPSLKDTRIIAYTAYAMRGDRGALLSEGFDDYLSKPVTVDSLSNLVNKYLGLGVG